jgi:hypothetical protein
MTAQTAADAPSCAGDRPEPVAVWLGQARARLPASHAIVLVLGQRRPEPGPTDVMARTPATTRGHRLRR